MTRVLLRVGVLFSLVSLIDGLYTPPTLAQITAAPDGTGTEVRREGDRITIQGGTLSRDQQNLFHSFERFGLSARETATFLSNPQIQNILGRITGGDASIIDGLLQVTGGHSNLYLMNPAGILFGPNARLDLPASFTATTATGIGFGSSRFNAISPSDYANLVGTPNEFVFATSELGAIANLGTLAVNPGESLTLLGGTVVNTGTLSAPGGQITIAAIPGQNAVRVSQDGLLLSLQLQALGQAPEALPFTPLTLPQLLTGGSLDNASTIHVNPDGTVSLTGSNIAIPATSGTAIASGTLTTTQIQGRGQTAEGSSPTPHTPYPTPQINVLGDRVALLSATLDASSSNGGGTIRIGGDYQGQGNVFNASRTYVSRDSVISADALDSGDGGRAIVWADDATQFYGTLRARGAGIGNGGFAEISGANVLEFDGSVNLTSPQGQTGTLLLDPDSINIVTGGINLPDLPSGGGTQLLFGDNPGGASTVNNGTIDAATANVVLQAINTITFSAPVAIATAGVGLSATANQIQVNAPITTTGGNIELTAMNSTADGIDLFGSLNSNGGNIILNGTGANFGIFLNTGESINSGTGTITLNGTGGSIGQQLQGAVNSGGGAIAITGTGIRAVALPGAGASVASGGGDITITGIQTPNSADRSLLLTGGSINAGTGNLTITGDAPDIIGSLGSTISGSGNLLIQPVSATAPITLGGTGTNLNFLDLEELQTLQNGFASITIGRADGSGAITLGGDITFNDPVTLRAPAGSIDTTGGTITGADNAAIALQALGNIATGNIFNPGRAITITSTAGVIDTTAGTISTGFAPETPSPRVIPGAGGDITIRGNSLNLGNISSSIRTGVSQTIDLLQNSGNIRLEAATGDINVANISTETFSFGGSLGFVGFVGNSGNVTVSAPSGDVNIAGGVTTNVTAVGAIDQAGNAGAIDISTATGTITVSGPVSARAIALGGGSTAGNSGTIAIAGPNINLGDNLDVSSLSLGGAAGSDGSISVTGNVALTQAIAALTANTGTVTVNGTINDTTAGANALTVNADTASFNGAIGNGISLGNLTVNSNGTTQFNGSVNAASLTTNAGGNTVLNGNVTTSGTAGQTYNDAVAIAGDAVLTADEINFAAPVSGTGALTLRPFTRSQPIRIGGTVDVPDALNLSSSDINALQDGFSSITIGRPDGMAETTVNAVIFPDPTIIRNQSITVNGAITGLGDASLRFVGETQLNANVSTSGQTIFFNSPVQIGANTDPTAAGISVTAGDDGSILFGSTIDGVSSGDNSLTLNAPTGLVRFNGAIGDSTPLSRLSVNAQQTEIGNDINTAGNITFNSPVTLLDRAIISAGRSTLTFNDTLTTGANDATLTGGEINLLGGENSVSGSGDLTLRQGNPDQAIQVGSVAIADPTALNLTPTDLAALADGFSNIVIEQPAGSGDIFLNTSTFRSPLTVRTANGSIFYDGDVTLPSGTSITFDSSRPIVLRRDITTQGNSLVFNHDVELRNDITLDTSSGGNNIVFGGAVEGDRLLTLRAGLGTIRFRGLVGSATPLRGVQIDSAASTEVRANINTNGAIRIDSPVSVFNNAGMESRTGAIAISQPITGLENSSVTLRTNGPITVQDITASDGGISLNSNANVTTRNLAARQTITVTGDANVSIGSITSQGGNIALTSDRNINVLGDISSSGGDIALTSGDAVVTQNLNSSSPTQGGSITVRATNSITTRQINSSSANGNGGNVLLDPIGDVQVDAIDARGGSNGRGGNVTIVAGHYFRAVSTIPELAPLTSISTAGGQGGGNIFIRHGGNGDIPFVIGANTQNGTLGAITTGNYTLAPIQSIEGDVTLGNIQITTSATNCVLQCPPPPLPPPPEPLPNVSFVEAQSTLQRVLEQTGVRPALIYVGFVPDQSSIDIGFEQREATSTQQIEHYLGRSGSSDGLSVLFKPKESDRLEIVIVTSSGEPIRRSVEGVTRGDIQRVTRQLLGQITDRSRENSTAYLRPAQQLYEWLITPIEADLQREKISNLSFIMDAGLRFVPIATLYDGQRFLVEKYSVGLMPSLGLTDTRRVDLRNAQVLAMGASQFTNQLPLPAVPVELSEINSIWQGEALLNSAFTPDNLKLQREQRPFGIVHLATHAEFNRGTPQNSYIQFWNQQLGLDQIRQLGLNNPPVELLVLSACRTALGDEDAELGFAGFAVQAGVRSVLASLWSVSDIGTLALMSEFYEQLRTAPTRSEALRRAQVAMLRGQVHISDGILTTSSGRTITLPSTLTGQNAPNLPYPLYWAAFTMIGNPW